MTSQQENSQIESSIDRRAVSRRGPGALTLAAQPALAQGAQTEAKGRSQARGTQRKRLSDTIADFVRRLRRDDFAAARGRGGCGFAFIDTFAVMLAGSREEGTGIVCEMVQQEGAVPRVSVVGQSFRTSPQLAALANGRRCPHHGLRLLLAPRPADLADHPGAAADRGKLTRNARRGDGGIHRRFSRCA